MASITLIPGDDDDLSTTSTTTRRFPPIVFPTTTTSSSTSSTSSSTTSSIISTETPLPQSDSHASKVNPAVPIGLVLGFVFGVALLIAVGFFLVRRHFVQKRTSSGRVTPARARLANAGFFKWGNNSNNSGDRATASLPYTKRRNLNISEPANFTHLESGSAIFDHGPSGFPAPIRAPPAAAVTHYPPQIDEELNGAKLGRTPSDKMKQKYADLLTLESGLGSHMETMANSRKPSSTGH